METTFAVDRLLLGVGRHEDAISVSPKTAPNQGHPLKSSRLSTTAQRELNLDLRYSASALVVVARKASLPSYHHWQCREPLSPREGNEVARKGCLAGDALSNLWATGSLRSFLP